MKKIIVICGVCAVFFLYSLSFAGMAAIDSPAAGFKVISGTGEELSLADIKGKVTVIFYETKDTKEKNRELKNELNKFYDAQSDADKKDIRRIPIINCAGVFFTEMWKKELRANSKKEGMAIYGDWDGSMASSYGFKADDSNLVIIDKSGMIRYIYTGKVEDRQIQSIKELLSRLIKE